MTFGALSLVGGRPDDGLDRRAAGADRPGGGLRDPVPGALRRGRGSRATGRRPRTRPSGPPRPAGRRSPRPGWRPPSGFLVLLSSPVPMVRGFGALLVLGIVDRARLRADGGLRRAGALLGAARARAGRARRTCRRAVRAASAASSRERAEALRDGRAGRLGGRARASARSPTRSRGRARCSRSAWRWRWSAGRWTPRPRSSPTSASWSRGDLQALKDVNELQEETGVSGEIDVTVRADDITDPEVLAWMTRFQQGALKAAGYEPGATLHARPRTRPSSARRCRCRTSSARSTRSNQQQVNALLDAVPAVLLAGRGHRRTARPPTSPSASGSGRSRTRRRSSTTSRTRLDPPEGVEASVVGLPVLAAEANGALVVALAARR